MLLTSMNYQEINAQVMNEYRRLWDTTVARLLQEYDRERKKLKIERDRVYARDYHIKTKGKNTWIICIRKNTATEKYVDACSTTITCAVYYYAEKGTRVLIPADDGRMSVFNAHFFARYNERLQLSLHRQVDVIAHFLKHNTDVVDFITPNGNRVAVTGYCKSGILLGELCYTKKWLTWKTFVNADLARADQEAYKKQLIGQLSAEVMSNLDHPFFKEADLQPVIAKIYGAAGKAQRD